MEMEDAVKCRVCGSYIRMDTGYDYIPCACGAIAVDGGPDYVRIIGHSNDYEIVRIPAGKEKLICISGCGRPILQNLKYGLKNQLKMEL